MRALQVTRNARPTEACEVVDLPLPEPGPGQVRVRVAAAALNFNDLDRCHGRQVSIPMPPPFVLGMDVCGVVDAAGDGAEAWIGERVVAITLMAQGGIAEYALASVDMVFAAPPELDDAEAAGFVIPYHTAHLALFERADLGADETLLVIAGASGVGSAAIQLGAAAGAHVVATAGGPAKTELCRSMGAELAIDHRSTSFPDAVFAHTDDVGADVVLDLAGGGFATDALRVTARGGRCVVAGFADDPDKGAGGIPLQTLSRANISVLGVLCAYTGGLPPEIRHLGFNPFGRDTGEAVHADLLHLVAEGAVRPHIGRRVGIDDAAATLEDHEARTTMGRSVVEIDGD